MDRKTLDQVEHLYVKDGAKMPYSAQQFQKEYGVTLLLKEPGIQKFMQMTGLKLNPNQVGGYLRKLRGIMSYDPNAKIDKFIRESVLEERNVDFTKLIEAKGNIERLNETFSMIQAEIGELELILKEYDTYENEKNRLLADDIKKVYRTVKRLTTEIEELTREQNLAVGKRKEIAQVLDVIEQKWDELNQRLAQARFDLLQLDTTKAIHTEEERLSALKQEKRQLSLAKDDLEQFQVKVSEILHTFAEENREVEKKDMLASLCDHSCPAFEKEIAVAGLKQAVNESYDAFTAQGALIGRTIEELNQKLAVQERILEEAKKRRNTYAQIPDYVGLKEEINREFAKRKISSEAKFACEYVIGIKEEAWRDSIEAFLGARRYTILVEPQYYDIADDVLNRSQYKYAHLFNTKLLMKKEIEAEKDSAVHFLEIRNPVAKKYFDFQLGRMHAVNMQEVREYENAISVEGRVSVAMDSYFLRFDRIRSYYLGQETFELNRKRAEKEIKKLQEERKEKFAEQKKIIERKNRLNQDKEFFRAYDFDAHAKYQKNAKELDDAEKQLKQLKKAQQNNKEYIELSQRVARLMDEQEAVKRERDNNTDKRVELDTQIRMCGNSIDAKTTELDEEEEKFKEYEISAYPIVQRAVEAYDKYVEAGMKGAGGLLLPDSRRKLVGDIERYRKNLIGLQSGYNAKHPESSMPIGESDREVYAKRRDRIWMDNLQEIREKLDVQTKQYEDIFKNEFVLTAYCEAKRPGLRSKTAAFRF